ncbi:hypothetical protein I302_107303 [Kwoniella bestiolae CBS 10118]|uniref:Secreted protein n=1 Tax=Kwoniella bestiolae CBS 10118 TaxID=1296100 RepID=A0A1B9FYY6_9TREE|nr:hypothetical protein I302_06961 [Kwoniella bestiolae CBS 10118]OCF23975.1 hypothetical protein I302_06961 [Kwoniella bestiolae CBS 10118]
MCFSKVTITLTSLLPLTSYLVSAQGPPQELVSSVTVNFGPHTKYQLINKFISEPKEGMYEPLMLFSRKPDIGEEIGFYLSTYDENDKRMTQNLTCTVKTLEVSDRIATYDLTDVVPFHAEGKNTDVASLTCV